MADQSLGGFFFDLSLKGLKDLEIGLGTAAGKFDELKVKATEALSPAGYKDIRGSYHADLLGLDSHLDR